MSGSAYARSLVTLCVLLLGISGMQAAEAVPLPTLAKPGMKFASDDTRRKISSQLVPFLGRSGPLDQRLRQAGQPASQPDLLRLRLDVEVTPEHLAAIIATGVRVIETSARWNTVVVEADLTQVTPLSQISAVHAVALLWKPRHRFAIGSYDNQADPLIHTDQVRSTFGTDGEGMTIGIMSDSLHSTAEMHGSGAVTGTPGNQVLTGSTLQVSGDLPSSILIVAEAANDSANSDEGAGMMESVHHLAPAAACIFASCGPSPTSMAANIAKFATAHCQVACDDIGFFDEPMFQDGPIAQAANDFVAQGGVYLSAAGNSGITGILATYSDVVAGHSTSTATTPDGTDFHDWGSGTSNGFLPLTIPSGEVLTVILQWNQPYHSYGLGAGAEEDFDLWLFASAATTTTLTVGGDFQGSPGSPGGDPFEALQYQNTTASPKTVYLAVDHFTNAASTAVLRLTAEVTGTTQLTSPVFNCGTTYGHPVAAQVLGVGAAPVANITHLEDFSSSGGWGASGLPFYFDTTGAALPGAPQKRNKPDLVAPDGAFNRWVVDTIGSPYTNFFGTSAATPHAAAAAALVWSVRPTLSNQQLMDVLRTTATDITAAPATSGDDAYAGHGLINAAAAIGTAVTVISANIADGFYASGSIPLTVSFNQPVVVSGQPLLALNTTPARNAVYTSGSGTPTLVFTYAISAGDHSHQLDSASRAALSLNGGTIFRQGTTTAVDISVPAPSSNRSLAPAHALEVDANTLSVQITAPSNPVGAFAFTVTFSHAVTSFTASDLTLINATAGTLTHSANTHVLQVTPTLSAAGTISASIAAGAVTDANGSPNNAASANVAWQPAPPVVPPAATPTGSDGGSSGGCGVGGSMATLLSLILLMRIRMLKHAQ